MRIFLMTAIIAIVSFVGFNSLAPQLLLAEGLDPACDKRSSFLNLPPWYAYLDVGPKTNKEGKVIDECAITGPVNPDNGEFSFTLALPRIALAVVEILLRVAGIVTFGFVVYGGFRYITSQGEPDALKQAQGTIINALVGMVIVILAVTIVAFTGSVLW